MEKFANFARTTLTNSIDADDTELVVEYATNFPTSGDFRLRCGNELMLVTAVAGTTFTVTRGVEGTTAAAHDAGTGAAHVMTAGSLGAAIDKHQWSSVSPASLTTNQTDWNPTGLHDNEWIRINTSGASAQVEISGIDAGSDGEQITISVVATSTYSVKFWCGSGTDANKILGVMDYGSVTISEEGSLTLRYDGTSARWRIISHTGQLTNGAQ